MYLDNNKDVRRAKDARVDAAPGSPYWFWMPYEGLRSRCKLEGNATT